MFGLKNKTEEKNETTTGVTYLPAVDIAENEAGYTIFADVPGAGVDSVEVTFEDGVVKLRATAAAKEAETSQHIHREFRLNATYERSFRVGEDVDSDAIAAEIANGVLKVTLPRKASFKKSISVAAK
jgi:HSP20 family molecular chaperone IbpA